MLNTAHCQFLAILRHIKTELLFNMPRHAVATDLQAFCKDNEELSAWEKELAAIASGSQKARGE